uniref:Family with sequence similarity 183 member A n=1 Tax=Crocodylus porosus TaxID=8502 RepID=A0A7M4FJJ6_CROPO
MGPGLCSSPTRGFKNAGVGLSQSTPGCLTRQPMENKRKPPGLISPAVARKPMSGHDAVEEPVDAKFLNLIHHAALEPTKKYSEPQTESQEIGWTTTPLVSRVP